MKSRKRWGEQFLHYRDGYTLICTHTCLYVCCYCLCNNMSVFALQRVVVLQTFAYTYTHKILYEQGCRRRYAVRSGGVGLKGRRAWAWLLAAAGTHILNTLMKQHWKILWRIGKRQKCIVMESCAHFDNWWCFVTELPWWRQQLMPLLGYFTVNTAGI